MNNWQMNFGIFFETALVSAIVYVPFLNVAFETRPLACPHMFIPGMSFTTLLFFFDEVRKIYLRQGIDKNRRTGRQEMNGWVVRNTYW
jgi:hypothetical protein